MPIIPNKLAFWRKSNNQTNVKKDDREYKEVIIDELTAEKDIDRVREEIFFDGDTESETVTYDETNKKRNDELEFLNFDEADEEKSEVEFRNKGRYLGSKGEPFDKDKVTVSVRPKLYGGRNLTVNPENITKRKPKYRHMAYIEFTYRNVPVRYTISGDGVLSSPVVIQLADAEKEWEIKYKA